MSDKAEDRDRARHLLTSVLTRGWGEYIFRIGSFPPQASIFLDEPLDGDTGVHGIPRTTEEITSIRTILTEIVDELGGKVCYEWFQSLLNVYPLYFRRRYFTNQ